MDREAVRQIYGEWFDRGTVTGLTRTLEEKRAAWIETDVLIAALRENAREPIPKIVEDYLRLRLDGQIRKRQGRGRSAGMPAKRLHRLLIRTYFERYQDWLASRRERVGLEGWTLIRDADWWQGSPAERAARMVVRRLRLNMTWRRVQDIAYGQ